MIKTIKQKILEDPAFSVYQNSVFVLCTAQNDNNSYPYKEAGFDYFCK